MFLESRNDETKNNRKNRPFSSHSILEPNLVPNDGTHMFQFIFSKFPIVFRKGGNDTFCFLEDTLICVVWTLQLIFKSINAGFDYAVMK